MHKKVLFIAMTATVIGLSGCSSTPDTGLSSDAEIAEGRDVVVSQSNIRPTGNQSEASSGESADSEADKSDAQKDLGRYSTSDQWSTVVMTPEKAINEAFRLAGIDPAWVDKMPESESEAVLGRLESSIVHVIHDEDGNVQFLYGIDGEGKYVKVSCKPEECRSEKPKGFVAETLINLSVGQVGSIDRLGLPQQLALKKLMSEIPIEDKIAFEQGDVSLSFKALFMNGKLIGPTQIIEAKTRFEGKEIFFPRQ